MLGMAHVILHLGLCNSMLKLRPQTTIPIQVRIIDKIGRPHLDKTFRVERGYEPTGVVEFNSPPGEYQMQIKAPKFACNAMDYVYFIPDHDRVISEQLVDGPAPQTEPMLLEGTAPPSFLYVAPTYVLFDKTTQCNKPVGDPIPVHMVVENDQDSFYIWLYPDASLYARGPEILAMQLQTSTGEDHYIRLKVPFPLPWHGFPDTVSFNVTEDVIDSVATSPTGVLLCPKLYETSAG
jgi:hypothetical protein